MTLNKTFQTLISVERTWRECSMEVYN